jgi:hydroxyacylglutathione hydrolase
VRRLADGVYQLGGFPPNAINVYLVGDVLVDAGTRHASCPIGGTPIGR